MGWIRLVLDLVGGLGDSATLITQNPYDNNWEDAWPFFRIASVLGTGFFPHRATTLGLPGLVAVVLLVGDLPRATGRPASCWPGCWRRSSRRSSSMRSPRPTSSSGCTCSRRAPGERGPSGATPLLFLAPVVLAIPFIADAVFRQSDSGGFRFVLGWGEARFKRWPARGPLLLRHQPGHAVRPRDPRGGHRRGTCRRAGSSSPGWSCCSSSRTWSCVSAVEFDMNKYFQIMWIAVAMLAAWLIRRLADAAIVGVLAVSRHLTGARRRLAPDQPGRRHERGAGARGALDRDGHAGALGLRHRRVHQQPGRPRRPAAHHDVPAVRLEPRLRPGAARGRHRGIYCDGPDVAAELMATYGATYVLSSGGILDCAADRRPTSASSDRFETVYDVDGVTVWRLKGES